MDQTWVVGADRTFQEYEAYGKKGVKAIAGDISFD